MLSNDEINREVERVAGHVNKEQKGLLIQQICTYLARGYELTQLAINFAPRLEVVLKEEQPAGKPYEAPKPVETTLEKLAKIPDAQLSENTNKAIENGDPEKASLYAGEMARRVRDGYSVGSPQPGPTGTVGNDPGHDEPEKKKRGRPPKAKAPIDAEPATV